LTRPVLLDSGPLGRIAHPRRRLDVDAWLKDLLRAGVRVIVPEIADYEVRRNLLLAGLQRSVAELDTLKSLLVYQPLTTPAMQKAAELWAEARRKGRPAADLKELDGDVILAAQALEVGAVVATDNLGHLSQFVAAEDWRRITPPKPPGTGGVTSTP
jgi:predicted nucleic acid-binding protein